MLSRSRLLSPPSCRNPDAPSAWSPSKAPLVVIPYVAGLSEDVRKFGFSDLGIHYGHNLLELKISYQLGCTHALCTVSLVVVVDTLERL